MGKQDERKTLEARETVETVEQKFCSRLSPRHAPGYAGHVKTMDERMDRSTHRQTKNSYLGIRLSIELRRYVRKSLSKKFSTIY